MYRCTLLLMPLGGGNILIAMELLLDCLKLLQGGLGPSAGVEAPELQWATAAAAAGARAVRGAWGEEAWE